MLPDTPGRVHPFKNSLRKLKFTPGHQRRQTGETKKRREEIHTGRGRIRRDCKPRVFYYARTPSFLQGGRPPLRTRRSNAGKSPCLAQHPWNKSTNPERMDEYLAYRIDIQLESWEARQPLRNPDKLPRMCLLFPPEEKAVLEMLPSSADASDVAVGKDRGLLWTVPNRGCVRTSSTPEETLTHGNVPPRGRRLPSGC